MKKTLFTFCMLSILSIGINAQLNTSNEENRLVKKGDVIFDAYYGAPNLFKTLFRAVFNEAKRNDPSFQSFSAVGFGPVGGQLQYLVDKNIGINLDVNYINFGIKWKEIGTTNKTEDYLIKFNTIRAMVGGEFHANSGKQIDFFGGVKIGVSTTSISFSSTDPAVSLSTYGFSSFRAGIGIASRLYCGIRFFPIKPLGLFVEGGIFGGGIVRGGLSVKI
jgi:hypothetical protein